MKVQWDWHAILLITWEKFFGLDLFGGRGGEVQQTVRGMQCLQYIVGSILNKYTPFPSSRWGLYFGLEARHIFSCLAKTHNIFPSSNIYNPDNYSTRCLQFSTICQSWSFFISFFPSIFLPFLFTFFPCFFLIFHIFSTKWADLTGEGAGGRVRGGLVLIFF